MSMVGAADPKLIHLVGRLLKSNVEFESNHDNIHRLVQQLCREHREYQRKNVAQLTRDVQSAVTHWQERHHANVSNHNTGKVKKRKHRPITSSNVTQPVETTLVDDENDDSSNRDNFYDKEDDDDDNEYYRAATLHDSIVVASKSCGNSLNDRLLQIRTVKHVSGSTDHHSKQSSGRMDITDSQNHHHEEISEGFADHDNPTDAPVFEMDQPESRKSTVGVDTIGTNDTVKLSSSSKRKRKIERVRRGSSNRVEGDGKSTNPLGGLTDERTSLSFTIPVDRPVERYSDLGGLDHIIATIRQLVEYPITRPELYRHLGVDPPRGVLFRGPPGTGKTHLANAVAGQLGVPFFRVSAPELVAGVSGESESRIRSLFQAASDIAPSLIFLDEIDAVAPNRGSGGSGDSGRGMEKRMVAQLLTCMDSLAPQNNRNQQAVLVLAATNRPDALDPALRRAGRFDKEILLGVPDEEARIRILRTMTKGMRLYGNTSEHKNDNSENDIFDFKLLARKTPGFVGADIRSLTKEAAVIAINRIFRDVLSDDTMHDGPTTESGDVEAVVQSITSNLIPLSAEKLDPLYVTMDDFLAAVPLVQPSSQREGFASIPDVSWDNIGALQSIREELTISVLEPIRSPEKFKILGLQLPAGVLLYGPPGCGKTLLAKAIAHESGANFISVKGPELLDKYIGESERAVRLVFERARCSSPCIIFFDELDSIVPRRGSDHGGGGGVTERVVNQLLTEMDGLESRRSVFIIAATNRPELIDPAMLRPGRLDKLLYVPLPTSRERASILQTLGAKVTLGDDVDLDEIGSSPRAEGYSGADLAALLREAGLAVLKEHMAAMASGMPTDEVSLNIRTSHFNVAFNSVLPSVSKKDHARYDKIRDRMAGARSRGIENVEEDITTVSSSR